jgi:cytochrome c-type biogenesis protein CcmH/NrfG
MLDFHRKRKTISSRKKLCYAAIWPCKHKFGGGTKMDNDVSQQILEELRKLRKANQWMSVVAVLALVAVCVWAIILVRSRQASQASPWTDVSVAMRQYDYTKALQLTQELATAHPDDYYPHSYLGYIYLQMGDLAHAEAEYSRAYELWPSENMQKYVEMVKKRRESEASKTK